MENPFKKAIDDNKENIKESEVDITVESENEAEENKTAEETEENNTEENTSNTNEWKEKYEELNNQYIRLAADFDNYRKRQAQERESLLKYGAEKAVKSLLEVADNFERGLKAIETVEDCNKLKECYNLAYKNFNDVMTKLGVEHISAEGEIFNPNLHEAVMQTPSSEIPEHTIISELQKGYTLSGKVIRPTLVNVATVEE